MNDQVDLQAIMGAPEVQIGTLASVVKTLNGFGHDKSFKKAPAHTASKHGFGAGLSRQIACQCRIHKVKLGAFDDALAKVAMKGPKQV